MKKLSLVLMASALVSVNAVAAIGVGKVALVSTEELAKKYNITSKFTPEMMKDLNTQGANLTKEIAMQFSAKFGGRQNAIEYAEAVDALYKEKYPD